MSAITFLAKAQGNNRIWWRERADFNFKATLNALGVT